MTAPSVPVAGSLSGSPLRDHIALPRCCRSVGVRFGESSSVSGAGRQGPRSPTGAGSSPLPLQHSACPGSHCCTRRLQETASSSCVLLIIAPNKVRPEGTCRGCAANSCPRAGLALPKPLLTDGFCQCTLKSLRCCRQQGSPGSPCPVQPALHWDWQPWHPSSSSPAGAARGLLGHTGSGVAVALVLPVCPSTTGGWGCSVTS